MVLKASFHRSGLSSDGAAWILPVFLSDLKLRTLACLAGKEKGLRTEEGGVRGAPPPAGSAEGGAGITEEKSRPERCRTRGVSLGWWEVLIMVESWGSGVESLRLLSTLALTASQCLPSSLVGRSPTATSVPLQSEWKPHS